MHKKDIVHSIFAVLVNQYHAPVEPTPPAITTVTDRSYDRWVDVVCWIQICIGGSS